MEYTITSEEIYNIITRGSKDNANIIHRAETVHKLMADNIAKQYFLSKFPIYIREAHLKGDIHLHDLEYSIRSVCCQHDGRPILKHGLKVDGTGRHTSVSKPAMRLDTAVQHVSKVLSTAQCEMSGGQSIDEMNIWLAPFVKGLPYKKVKQAMQMLVYELNQMYVARGPQAVFSSVNLEIGIPSFLKNKPAIAYGKEVGTYGEYEEESKIILSALCDVLLEGHSNGRMHLFPNFIVKLRDNAFKDENKEIMNKLYQLVAKYGLVYFINMIADFQGENTNAMGCRTRLSSKKGATDDEVAEQTLRTGNMQWYTLNLPRIAYQSNGDDTKLFEILDCKLEIISDALIFKSKLVEDSLYKNNLMPFLTQQFDGEQYYGFDMATRTFGFNGLNEMLRYHCGGGITEYNDFGLKVISHIREYADNMSTETGLRWTVTQTPAETTASRFAGLDYKYYKPQVQSLYGNNINDGELYYTNSSHVNVDEDITMGNKVKIESQYHEICNGGHIMNFWSMDRFDDLQIIEDVTKKIMKTQTGYWTYTKNMSFCNDCGYKSFGINNTCKQCDSQDIDSFSRITGYLQNVNNWNKAKQKELHDRKTVIM